MGPSTCLIGSVIRPFRNGSRDCRLITNTSTSPWPKAMRSQLKVLPCLGRRCNRAPPGENMNAPVKVICFDAPPFGHRAGAFAVRSGHRPLTAVAGRKVI
ncbi:hypothetical protein AWB81_06692 [Caballeronia arationis]|jgi:hypothetical protein|uniref:Uncharacterized protein n=1 Tax=Caballeronia arationis TaxID=1777142 RepID=A0A7Z7N2I5_9BURK|nr:hypothetical protein AWB81_06692 [Caballeronia arationis]SOE66703.1 hypothetical protein SAMN05446927_3123 [Caballeronia arationis]